MALQMPVARRGRPKSSSLAELIREGETKNGLYKCKDCNRVFPRNKSLMAHERTHTGKTPYICTYPECHRAFKQSGQLKTHEKRHTGEKPFACPVEDCSQRFIHSSRQCPKHSGLKLKKDGLEKIHYPENLSEEELRWLQEYEENKNNPSKRRKQTECIKMPKTEFETLPESALEDSSSGVSTDNCFSGSSGLSRDNCSYSSSSPSGMSTDGGDDSLMQTPNEQRDVLAGQIYNNFSFDHPAFEAALILCSFTKQSFKNDSIPENREMGIPQDVCQ